MANRDKVYGWWSEKQVSIGGYSIYTKADGSRVKVSMVSSTVDRHETYWDDIVSLGEVENFVVRVEPDETEEQAFVRQEKERAARGYTTEKQAKIAEETRTFAHSRGLTTFTVFRS